MVGLVPLSTTPELQPACTLLDHSSLCLFLETRWPTQTTLPLAYQSCFVILLGASMDLYLPFLVDVEDASMWNNPWNRPRHLFWCLVGCRCDDATVMRACHLWRGCDRGRSSTSDDKVGCAGRCPTFVEGLRVDRWRWRMAFCDFGIVIWQEYWLVEVLRFHDTRWNICRRCQFVGWETRYFVELVRVSATMERLVDEYLTDNEQHFVALRRWDGNLFCWTYSIW